MITFLRVNNNNNHIILYACRVASRWVKESYILKEDKVEKKTSHHHNIKLSCWISYHVSFWKSSLNKIWRWKNQEEYLMRGKIRFENP